MEQNLKNQIKPVKINGKLLTLQEKNKEIGMEHNFCFKFFESINCILRGEAENLHQDKRNAVITASNLLTGESCKNIY